MSLQELKWFERPGLGTVQRNWINTINRKWIGWTQGAFGGATISISGEEATIRTNGAGGFGAMVLDVSAILPIIGLNRTIAISFEVRNAGAGFVMPNFSLGGVVTLGAGSAGVTIGAPFTAGQRYGCRFTLTASTSPALWIGIGANGVAEGSDKTLIIRRPVVEILDGNSAPYFEGLAAQDSNVYPYRAKATLSGGNISGLVTVDRSDLVTVPPDRFGLVIGDSFSVDYLNGQSWPVFIRQRFPQLAFRMRATAGISLSTIATEIDDYLTAPDEVDRLDVPPTFAILQGSVNGIDDSQHERDLPGTGYAQHFQSGVDQRRTIGSLCGFFDDQRRSGKHRIV
jgi:hypothetical protein